MSSSLVYGSLISEGSDSPAINKKYKGKQLSVVVSYSKPGFTPYKKTLKLGKVKG